MNSIGQVRIMVPQSHDTVPQPGFGVSRNYGLDEGIRGSWFNEAG